MRKFKYISLDPPTQATDPHGKRFRDKLPPNVKAEAGHKWVPIRKRPTTKPSAGKQWVSKLTTTEDGWEETAIPAPQPEPRPTPVKATLYESQDGTTWRFRIGNDGKPIIRKVT